MTGTFLAIIATFLGGLKGLVTYRFFSFFWRNIRAGGMPWQVLSFRLLTAHIWLTSFILPCLFNDIFITLINVKYLNFGSPSKRKLKQTRSVKRNRCTVG